MRKSLAIVLVISVVFVAKTLCAQEETQREFSLQNFQSAPGYLGFLTVEGAQVPEGIAFRTSRF